MDVRAIGMDQTLGCEACQILWWAFGLDHQALFWGVGVGCLDDLAWPRVGSR